MANTDSRIPVQIVFQGGGAKLCALMAVCEVLKSDRFSKRISINRVGGSSAGAIAAVMLASGKSVEYYMAHVKTLGNEYLRLHTPYKIIGYINIMAGRAYFSNLNLRSFFEDLFCKGSDLRLLSDLRIDTKIYYCDLYSLGPRTSTPSDTIPQALAKSCNFPLAFVGYRSEETDVDGGLALNLPVDEMKADETTKGRVIGVSFAPDFGKANGLQSYAYLLFSAAIQSSVLRSQNIIGENNVFQIKTDISTFDFEESLKNGFGTEYDLVKERFATWFDGWLKQFEPLPPSRDHRFRPARLSPPLPKAVVGQIDDSLRSVACTRTDLVRVTDLALLDDKGEFTGRYRSRTMLKFRIIRPIHALQMDFDIGHAGSFSAANLLCAGTTSRGDALIFDTDVQELTKAGEDIRSFRLYFYFSSRLTPESPGQPYVLEFEHDASDPFPRLGVGIEYYMLAAVVGDADEMILNVAFPSSRMPKNPVLTDLASATAQQFDRAALGADHGKLVASEEISVDQFLREEHFDRPLKLYYIVGRRARNVERGKAFGFMIE